MKKLKPNYAVFASDIIRYTFCTCGAITIETETGTYSCKVKNLSKLFPNLDLRQCRKAKSPFTWDICDHCVNGYGLDLCSCGSGAPVGECSLCDSKEPMQSYGAYERVPGPMSFLAR